MKQVVLVRHAKSVPYGYDDDFNRSLTGRGESDAALISNYLKKQKTVPDLIISSPARRACETARIYAGNLDIKEEDIIYNEDIYEGITTSEFIVLLQKLPVEINSVFVFGHNPTVYYLVNNLVKFFNGDMPTCSTVGIRFQIDQWEQLEARHGHVDFHFTPRMFK